MLLRVQLGFRVLGSLGLGLRVEGLGLFQNSRCFVFKTCAPAWRMARSEDERSLGHGCWWLYRDYRGII